MQCLLRLSVYYQIHPDCCMKVTSFARACCYNPSIVDRGLLGAEVECGNRPLVARELFLNSRQGLGAGVRARAEAARKLGGVGPRRAFFLGRSRARWHERCCGKKQVRTDYSRTFEPCGRLVARRDGQDHSLSGNCHSSRRVRFGAHHAVSAVHEQTCRCRSLQRYRNGSRSTVSHRRLTEPLGTGRRV